MKNQHARQGSRLWDGVVFGLGVQRITLFIGFDVRCDEIVVEEGLEDCGVCEAGLLVCYGR